MCGEAVEKGCRSMLQRQTESTARKPSPLLFLLRYNRQGRKVQNLKSKYDMRTQYRDQKLAYCAQREQQCDERTLYVHAQLLRLFVTTLYVSPHRGPQLLTACSPARRLAPPQYTDPWHLINAKLTSRCAPARKEPLGTACPRAAATSLRVFR